MEGMAEAERLEAQPAGQAMAPTAWKAILPEFAGGEQEPWWRDRRSMGEGCAGRRRAPIAVLGVVMACMVAALSWCASARGRRSHARR